jgi:hypothetical protein
MTAQTAKVNEQIIGGKPGGYKVSIAAAGRGKTLKVALAAAERYNHPAGTRKGDWP